MAGDAIVHHQYAPPAGFDFNDKEALKAYVGTLPDKAFYILLTFWVLSVFAAALIAALIARAAKIRVALIVGIILMIGSAINVFTIPHPVWLRIITIVQYIPVAYIGGRLGMRFSHS